MWRHPHLACAAGTGRFDCRYSCFKGLALDLSSDQVSAAEFVGVEFVPASPDQVNRLSMQRKIFRIDGAPMLATRDGGFFETAATLTGLIAEGETQRRDMLSWQVADTARAPEPEAELAPVPAAAPPLPPPAAPAEEAVAAIAQPQLGPLDVAPASAEAYQRRARQQRWVTAGAERRGRVSQHWSARRK